MYETLAELIAAYKRGDGRTGPVWVGKDQVSVWEGQNKVFRSTPDKLLTEALELLGVPWESV